MTESEIRLECLKLAHRHDRDAPAIVERAKVFEAYVNQAPAEKPVPAEMPKPGTHTFPIRESKGKK